MKLPFRYPGSAARQYLERSLRKTVRLNALGAAFLLCALTGGCDSAMNTNNSSANTNTNFGDSNTNIRNTNKNVRNTNAGNTNVANTNAILLGTPTPSPTQESDVDAEIQRLGQGVTGFQVPTAMGVGEIRTVVVQLSTDPSKGPEIVANLRQALNQNLNASTREETADVLFSRIMQAKLEGQGFGISALTPERQAVSRTQLTEWRWEIKALTPGPATLHLSMTAFLNLDGREETRALPVLSREINVETANAPIGTRIAAFFSNKWPFLIGLVLLLPLGIWLWVKSRKRRSRTAGNIFVSYRRGDSAGHTGRLSADLRRHFGDERIFMDIDTISPGKDFVEVVESALQSCNVFIAVIGKDWLAASAGGTRRIDDPKDWVRLETATALKRGIPLIPVLVEDAALPQATELPDDLQKLTRRQATEISDHRWDYDVDQLVRAIDKLMDQQPAPPK